MHTKLYSIIGALCLHLSLHGIHKAHITTESAAFYRNQLAEARQIQQAKDIFKKLKIDDTISICNDMQEKSYVNTLQSLASLYKNCNDIKVKLDAAYLLGENYFRGYTTYIAAPDQGAQNYKKALAYLQFIAQQRDTDTERQAKTCLMLGKIYATGVRGWCYWKIPVDTDEARAYFKRAKHFSDDATIQEQAEKELKLL